MTRNELGQGWGVGQSTAFQAKETACTEPPKRNTSQFCGNVGRTDKGPMLPQVREGKGVCLAWKGTRVEAGDPVTAIQA